MSFQLSLRTYTRAFRPIPKSILHNAAGPYKCSHRFLAQFAATTRSYSSQRDIKDSVAGSPEGAYKSKSIPELLSLKGRVTVVTGGGRGIGLALARGAAELGSDVAILDNLEQPHSDFWELERDLDVRARYYRTDVTNFGQLSTAFETISAEFGKIDNCVTAAGIVLDKPFLDHEWEESARILNVNVMGTFFASQLAAKHMRAQKSGGSIAMIASISAHQAIPAQRLSIYAASKGGVKSLCQWLAVELAPLGIRVNSISPGYIETDMTKALGVQYPELLSVFQSAAPIKRMGDRRDLKTVVAYLLSDAAAYTTGSDILVTGGLHSGRI